VKIVFLFGFLISSLFASDPYKNITHFTLGNGLNVYLYPDNKAKNTQIIVDVKVGMKAENKENAGLSHLVEHIVFRDQRVKDKDYLDFFKDEGATFVNGYTQQYKTQYLTTIGADKSYWIVEQFAQMLLDKNVTDEDLKSERGALQVEIGEVTWVDRYLPNFGKIFENIENIVPDMENFYKDEFGIYDKDDEIKYMPKSIYRQNNQNFTLEEVMKHYDDYYYPSNIILNVAGNFDLNQMKITIEQSFGKFANKNGKTIEKKHRKIAKLNLMPYERYDISMNGNKASIGTKFISNDPKKIIILDSYVNDLSSRLNKIFRNKNGESYGVHGYTFQEHNAAVALIHFSSPHNAFDKNIEYVKNQIQKESNGKLTDEQIAEALKASRIEYSAIEHDSTSLMNMIFDYQGFNKTFSETKTPYEILDSITPEEFKLVVKEAFVSKNYYQKLYRDYYFFPYDFIIFISLLILLTFYMIYRLFTVKINKRNIRMQRKLTGWFLSILIIASSIIIAGILTAWLVYFMLKLSPISYLWINGYDMPISYIVYFIDFAFSLLITYIVIKLFFNWLYIKLYATEHSIILSGVKSKYIKHHDIKSLEVVSWKPSLWRDIHGLSLLFWKPLLKVTLNHDDIIYLRASNAQHLKYDLESIVLQHDKKRKVFG